MTSSRLVRASRSRPQQSSARGTPPRATSSSARRMSVGGAASARSSGSGRPPFGAIRPSSMLAELETAAREAR